MRNHPLFEGLEEPQKPRYAPISNRRRRILAEILAQAYTETQDQIRDIEREPPALRFEPGWYLDHISGLRVQSQRLMAALARLKQGRYGFCLRCLNEISVETLRALPFKRLCPKCEAEEQARYLQRKRSERLFLNLTRLSSR